MQEKSLDRDLKQEIDRMQDWFYRTNFHKVANLNEINFTEKVMHKLDPVFERLLGFSLLAKDLKGSQKILSDFILNQISSIGEVFYEKNKQAGFEEIDIPFLKHIFEYVYKGIEIYRKLKMRSESRNLKEILNKVNLKFKDFSDKFLELKNKENTDKEIIFDEAIDILHAAYNELFSIFSNRSINSIFYNKFFFLEAFLSESRREVLAMLHMDKKEMYGEIPSQETMDSIFYQRQTIEKYLEEWLKIV